MFHKIFMDSFHTQFECGKYLRILCGILSILRNIVMDMNNVMFQSPTLKDSRMVGIAKLVTIKCMVVF